MNRKRIWSESFISRRTLLRAGSLPLAMPLLEALQDERAAGVSALLDGKGFSPVPAGEFQMGSANGNADEQPIHRVRITRAFEMGKYEVTQEQWDGVMRDPHGKPQTPVNPSHFKGPGLPVESVSWDDVQLFLKRINARDSGYVFRLPSEAEWEYACRAGSTANGPAEPDDMAWYLPNAGKQTHRVGDKAPNAWGLCDMLGNVAEWVQDWFSRDYYQDAPLSDPPGPDTGSYRVYRGGCWFDAARNCQAAYRGFDFPSDAYYNVGFRLVREARR